MLPRPVPPGERPERDTPVDRLTGAAGDSLVGEGCRVYVAGIVPPGASGVADYGRLVADALGERGFCVDEQWVFASGRHWPTALRASIRLLRDALRVSADDAILWHYSSFAYGYRGIPLPGVLFGLLARIRGRWVVTILHEPAYPRGRRGFRGAVHWATQWCALRPVLLGSSVVVVTTDRRADDVRRLRRPFRRVVHSLPVFSTLGVPVVPSFASPQKDMFTVGVLKYTGDGARPDVLIGAIAQLQPNTQLQLVLIGAPGANAPESRSWVEEAQRHGVQSRLKFSGVVRRSDLSRQLLACDLVVIPNDEGPSGRRTTLAAALAHGLPTLALDGPDRWSALTEDDALVVVPATATAVADALEDLLRSPDRRATLSARGRDFYDRKMTLDRTSDCLAELLAGDRGPS